MSGLTASLLKVKVHRLQCPQDPYCLSDAYRGRVVRGCEIERLGRASGSGMRRRLPVTTCKWFNQLKPISHFMRWHGYEQADSTNNHY